jgi:hypothetical protein
MSKREKANESIKDQLVSIGVQPDSEEYLKILEASSRIYASGLQASNSTLPEIRTDLAKMDVVNFLQFMGYPVLDPKTDD